MYLPNVDHEFDIEDTTCLLDIGHSKEGFSDEFLQLAIGPFQSTAKRSFTTDHEKPFPVHFQGITDSDELCVKDGQIGVPASNLHDIFEPIASNAASPTGHD
ncbi:hypothetical protein PG989_001098 [Apiospora arundinis]